MRKGDMVRFKREFRSISGAVIPAGACGIILSGLAEAIARDDYYGSLYVQVGDARIATTDDFIEAVSEG